MKHTTLLLSAIAALLLAGCNAKTPVTTDLAKNNIIPKPVSVTAEGGSFVLTAKSDIHVMPGGPEELA